MCSGATVAAEPTVRIMDRRSAEPRGLVGRSLIAAAVFGTNVTLGSVSTSEILLLGIGTTAAAALGYPNVKQ